MTDGIEAARVKLGAWVVAERKSTAFLGSAKVVNDLREETSITVPVLTLDVRITERSGIQAATSVPLLERSAIISRPTGDFKFTEDYKGLGDTSLIGWYRLPRLKGWTTVLNLGASLPTGRTETPRFRSELVQGSLVPMSRLQRGSGTLDLLFGMNLNRRFNPFVAFAGIAARTPLYENDKGLRTGAAFEVYGGLARELFTHRVVALGRLAWLHRERDYFRGTPVLVGGGHWMYLTPGIALQLGHGINVQAEVKIPVYRNLANTQLDSPALYQLGISRSFF